MRIGMIEITRRKKDPLGRPVHPWELVTQDQLSAEARALIAKMARAALKDHLAELEEQRREQEPEQLRLVCGPKCADGVHIPVAVPVVPVVSEPSGPCALCGAEWEPGVPWVPVGHPDRPHSWAHKELGGCVFEDEGEQR